MQVKRTQTGIDRARPTTRRRGTTLPACLRGPRLRVISICTLVMFTVPCAQAARMSSRAASPTPVPCSSNRSYTYDCFFYPAGNGISAGAPVQAPSGQRVGYLNYGINFVYCQVGGAEVANGPYHNNNWAYTEANNGARGWVNAVWARGGTNDGPYGGVPACPDNHGSPPGGAGTGAGDGCSPAPASAPLAYTHAHNDELQKHPLCDALSHRFSSVEADVWLTKRGRLVVGHDKNTPEHPVGLLQALYLEPLRKLVRAHGGHVYARSAAPLQLLLDVKTDGTKTYEALDRLFREHYAPILTSWSRSSSGGVEQQPGGMVQDPGAMRVVISGAIDRPRMKRQAQRYAAYDGGLCDLGVGKQASRGPACRASTESNSLMPLVSANWTDILKYLKWNGSGKMSSGQRVLLHALVDQAHGHGRQVRFWNTPDASCTIWRDELDAGVDLLNTDQLGALENFLAPRDEHACPAR